MPFRIRRLFLRFDFNPPLSVLHLTQPKRIHCRRPRLPFLLKATVSRCVLVAVLFDEKFHSRQNKAGTHPQAFVASGLLNHADVADHALWLGIPDNLFFSSALWTTKFHSSFCRMTPINLL